MVPEYPNREAMRRHLFPDRSSRRERGITLRRPRKSDIGDLARYVADAPEAEAFKCYLVGSHLADDGDGETKPPRDIDVFVTKRDNRRITTGDIERILLSLRFHGVHRLSVSVDPFYRSIDEREVQHRTRHGMPFSTWKLDSPSFTPGDGSETDRDDGRRVGRFLIRIVRTLSETNYFRKLPFEHRSGAYRRVLRPAVPLEEYLDTD